MLPHAGRAGRGKQRQPHARTPSHGPPAALERHRLVLSGRASPLKARPKRTRNRRAGSPYPYERGYRAWAGPPLSLRQATCLSRSRHPWVTGGSYCLPMVVTSCLIEICVTLDTQEAGA